MIIFGNNRYYICNNRYYICMSGEGPTSCLSSREAASYLDVSPHQIAMLAGKAEIRSREVGGTLLIDPFSLRQYHRLYRGKGRPLSPDVAWGALWLLSGLDAPWLSAPQRRRLLLKLRDIEPEDLVWQARKRASLRVFRVARRDFPALREALVLSGKSTDRPDIFDMPENAKELEGYASAETIERLRAEHELYEDMTGNLLVHTLAGGEPPWPRGDILGAGDERRLPVAAVACGLAASLDPREARAGIHTLGILLRAFRTL